MTCGCDFVNLKKILDSNILIYSILEGHPASEACEQLIISGEGKFNWVTSPITYYETFHILIRVYGMEPSQVLNKIKEVMDLPFDIQPLDSRIIITSLEKSIFHSIDMNDSVLLMMGINLGIPIIATDDRKLIKACENYGITCENPITETLRDEMRAWESKNLPEKGIGRIYYRVYDWLIQKDMNLAEIFKNDTRNFTKLL